MPHFPIPEGRNAELAWVKLHTETFAHIPVLTVATVRVLLYVSVVCVL